MVPTGIANTLAPFGLLARSD
ncbi:QVPTGV class sortase B protein-sorting domain-containing protein [Streptomyces sp. NPDC006739]